MNENKNPQITLTKSSSISEILLENDSNAKEIFLKFKTKSIQRRALELT